jgi:hypothetical protein
MTMQKEGIYLKQRVGLVLGGAISRSIRLNGGFVNLGLGDELLGLESGNTTRS